MIQVECVSPQIHASKENFCAPGVLLLSMFLFLSGASCEIAAGGNGDAPVQAANDRKKKTLQRMLVVVTY